MTRTTQILALLISLVTLAVLAPTAGAATTPEGVRYSDPQGWRAGSLDPNSLKRAADPNPRAVPMGRFAPNPKFRIVDPNGRFAPEGRFSTNGRFAPTGSCYRC